MRNCKLSKSIILCFLTISLVLLSACSGTHIDCSSFAGEYRAYILSDDEGTTYYERNLGLDSNMCLSISETGELSVDLYAFSAETVVALTGTVNAELTKDQLIEVGIDLADKDDADAYYEIEFDEDSVCYMGCWFSNEEIEVFYYGGNCTFLREDDPIFNVTTLNDILGQEGVYCLHADGSITEAEALSSSYIEDLYIYEGAEPLVIDRENGDMLIYIGDIVRTYSDMFEMQYQVEKYYWSGAILDFEEIAEIEGVDIDGVCEYTSSVNFALHDYLEPIGFTAINHPLGMRYSGEGILASKEKRSYTYGYYEGTSWVEEEDENYRPYYYKISNGTEETDWDYVFEAPVIKGKEGYFTIDLTNVEAGLYVGEFNLADDFYAFEIK